MGVLFTYFSADSDEQAASVIDLEQGPASSPDVRDTVPLKGIEPVVQMGTLEELLTGRPYDEVTEDPRWADAVAVRRDGELLVLTLTDGLTSALAGASESELAVAARGWARTEELDGSDPSLLGHILTDLSGLAQSAAAGQRRLYCWVCV